MVLGKDHKGRVVGKEGVRMELKKTFGKECVATQSSTMPPENKNIPLYQIFTSFTIFPKVVD